MSIKNLQVVYESDIEDSNKIHWLWADEAKALEALGICAGTIPNKYKSKLIFRGSRNLVKQNYESDNRYINKYEHLVLYNRMSNYFNYISDLSIETFFADDLDESVVTKLEERGWRKAFIKRDIKSLEFIDQNKSVWPITSFDEMKKLYEESGIEGKYAIRKFIDPERLEDEIRYWVFNGRIYRRDGIIPEIVKEAAMRLNKLGSKYYTIDATPEFVVEVNPGESSDRHAENSAELFASWIKKEFAI